MIGQYSERCWKTDHSSGQATSMTFAVKQGTAGLLLYASLAQGTLMAQSSETGSFRPGPDGLQVTTDDFVLDLGVRVSPTHRAIRNEARFWKRRKFERSRR